MNSDILILGVIAIGFGATVYLLERRYNRYTKPVEAAADKVKVWINKMEDVPENGKGEKENEMSFYFNFHKSCIESLEGCIPSVQRLLNQKREASLTAAWNEFRGLGLRFRDMPTSIQERLQVELYGHLQNPPANPETGRDAVIRCLKTIYNALTPPSSSGVQTKAAQPSQVISI